MQITFASEKEELSKESSEFPVGTFAQIDCSDGSQLKGGNSEIICTEDGEWDGEMGMCEEVLSEDDEKTTQQWTTTKAVEILSSSTHYSPSSHASYNPSSSSSSARLDVATEPARPLHSAIPERFWVELRNYLFHGCQATAYQSVLCRVMMSRPRFSDLSHNAAGPVTESEAFVILKRTSTDPSLNSLTIDSFYSRVVQGNSIPENSLRQFLSFSMDTIIWNYDTLQLNDNELANLLTKIVKPPFENFQLNHDFEELFSSIPTSSSTAEVTAETATEKAKLSCAVSQLPELANGLYEVVDESVVYKCKSTFRMHGEFLVICGPSGRWEVTQSATCQRRCGLLQIPETMRPQSMAMLAEDLVRLECVPGYEFHGRPNVRCQPSGSWSKILGMCSSE